ncbi:MAG: class I SAM-dependent RNA methyltransferase [Pyrinomonadaceae bacterium]
MSVELTVDIERILPGGLGLAHSNGETIFVSLAAPDDRLRVTIDRRQRNVAFASIKEILDPSPLRVEPPCPYFGRCGGCDFQQLTYDAQLLAKSEIIRDCLHRIAKLSDPPDVKVQPSPEVWRYRGRAVWQVSEDKQAIGYYERGSRRVCDIADCAVLLPQLQATLERVRSTPISEMANDLKHLEVVTGDDGVSLAPEFAEFQTNEVTLRIGDETYAYNARAFFQINQTLLEKLVTFALGGRQGETAVDLYCGVGLFTLPLARRFRKVFAVEANGVASAFCRKNLERANLQNARTETATVGEWLRVHSKKSAPVDLVLLDPPRAGAESVVIRGVLDLEPARICYVSCDPATLARDLKKLVSAGYSLDSIMAFDMFPQTHHVETVVHLVKQ